MTLMIHEDAFYRVFTGKIVEIQIFLYIIRLNKISQIFFC